VKRYEGLFILNTAAKDEGVNEILDKIGAEIKTAGGKIETVQKMERKAYARVADQKHTAGFYANIIFSIAPAAIAALRTKFGLNEEVFRVIFTLSPEPKPAK
jgi:ribosomal protein S6